MKPIYDLTPFTLLDYPDHTACIIWFAGCNFRCPYCHNPDMISGKNGMMEVEEILSFLEKRRGKLDGVVFSGGEATSYPGILELSQTIKGMGFKVKLDTNGSRPDVLRQIIDERMFDYIALDYKAPDCKFESICGFKRQNLFKDALKLICRAQGTSVEIRTTVHTDLLSEDDIVQMMGTLSDYGYGGTYYVQNYRDTETLGNLPSQARVLDITTLPEAVGFKTEFRNF